MNPRTSLLFATLLAATAVALGAFAAHALHDTLVARGQLANWHTAVRYQMWHALALLALGLAPSSLQLPRFPALAFLLGSVLFSGSIYCLAFGVLRPVMIPLTPLGGTLLLAGWLALALWAWRTSRTDAAPA